VRPILAWIALVLALVGTSAHAALPPKPAGPILDQANIIPQAQESALDAKLKAYTQATGRAVMVVTIPSLDGQDIESFGSALGHAWAVGGKGTDQGLILIVAPSERKVRIEVGYGLEEYLPDVLAGRIVQQTITPKFKAGDFPGGIDAGIDAITTQLDRTPADAKAVAEAAAAAMRNAGQDEGASIPSVIFWIVLIVFFMFVFGGRRGRRGYRRSGIDPGIVLWGASEAMRGFGSHGGGGFGGGGDSGGGWGGFGGGDFGGGGASGDW
jgi:uncharacterized protein